VNELIRLGRINGSPLPLPARGLPASCRLGKFCFFSIKTKEMKIRAALIAKKIRDRHTALAVTKKENSLQLFTLRKDQQEDSSEGQIVYSGLHAPGAQAI
jgi:hypothetical protein